MLIVCEGEKTEPNYFKGFLRDLENSKIRVKIIGEGYNTVSLVKRTIELRGDEANYCRVWVVFDRDSFKPQDFNKAMQLAKNENIDVAYSNQAFELWYLLHFHYYDTARDRDSYKKMLSILLNREYQKNGKDMYAELKDRQEAAIRNARKLLERYNPPAPEKDNPSTTVHLLVKELNVYRKDKWTDRGLG